MTQTNLQFADQLCQRMIANGTVKSQADFSELWLGRSPSYLSSSKARQRNVPDAAIQFLFDRLNWRMQNYQSQPRHMMGIKPWRDEYEITTLLQMEVQNHMTWKAIDVVDPEVSGDRLKFLVQRIMQEPIEKPLPTAFAKLIQFAAQRKPT